MIQFNKKILFVGYGAVAQCTLPILVKHLKVPLKNITVMDFGEVIARGAPKEIQSNAKVIEAYLGEEVE